MIRTRRKTTKSKHHHLHHHHDLSDGEKEVAKEREVDDKHLHTHSTHAHHHHQQRRKLRKLKKKKKMMIMMMTTMTNNNIITHRLRVEGVNGKPEMKTGQ
jgi:hypothetical protein